MNKKVLITGASGFIGSHCLSYLLERDYEVHALVHNSNDNLNEKIKWYKADLLDVMSIDTLIRTIQPTHLLHLAWTLDIADYRNAIYNLSWLTIGVELYKSFINHGGQRALLAGTCFEYDLRFGVCQEYRTPNDNSSLYSAAKNSLRELTTCLANYYNRSLAWARIFYVYGPNEGQLRLVPSIISDLLNSRTVQCSHGRQLRDYMYVQDVAKALVQILDSDVRGIINVGSGSVVRISELVDILMKLYPRSEVDYGAIKSIVGEPQLIAANTTRLNQEVGFYPEVSLEAGLNMTAKWWRDYYCKQAVMD